MYPVKKQPIDDVNRLLEDIENEASQLDFEGDDNFQAEGNIREGKTQKFTFWVTNTSVFDDTFLIAPGINDDATGTMKDGIFNGEGGNSLKAGSVASGLSVTKFWKYFQRANGRVVNITVDATKTADGSEDIGAISALSLEWENDSAYAKSGAAAPLSKKRRTSDYAKNVAEFEVNRPIDFRTLVRSNITAGTKLTITIEVGTVLDLAIESRKA